MTANTPVDLYRVAQALSTLDRWQGRWIYVHGIGRICLTPGCDCARTPEALAAAK